MKTMKKPWELTCFIVSYRSVKRLMILCLLTVYFATSLSAYAGNRPDVWAQNSFLVQPKHSKKSRTSGHSEDKAMAQASALYSATALSAQYLGKKEGQHLYKVKLRKNGRIFFKTVKVK